MPLADTWRVVSLEAYPLLEGQQNVVYKVNWLVNVSDGEDTGCAYGSQNVSLELSDGFTPFEQLTEQQVIGWVHEAMGVEQVSAHIADAAADLDARKNPPVVAPVLPWLE